MSKFDSIQTGRPVGSHLTVSKGRPRYDGADIEPGTRFAVALPTWEDGHVQWKDHKIADIVTQNVAEHGLMQEPLPKGYSKYTSVMVIDQDGGLGTFTSSSFGGHYAIAELIPAYRMQKERAIPVCELRTRDRNDDFGNIDPMFKIVG
jgi:hypothetical protein